VSSLALAGINRRSFRRVLSISGSVFYHRVLNLTGSVGTTNEINARRKKRKKELL
jgi:hypothetical protein